MKYREYKVGFTFEVPDNFSEVREASYEVFNVAENTLKYFIELNDDGEIVRSISLNRDEGLVKTDDDLKNAIQDNVELLEQAGLTQVENNILITDSGRQIHRYVFADLEQEENIGLLFYFTRIKNALIVSSCYINNFYDFFEDELFNIFNSIEEL